jgi:hypothetical protein
MSSNFEWQRHYVKEQIQGRMEEAASHRLAKQGSRKRKFPLFSAVRAIYEVARKAIPVIRKPIRTKTSRADRYAG